MKRNEDSLRGPWYNIKCTSICIIGVPEGEEREKGPENTFEVIIDALMAESEEELKRILIKVKEESKKAGLKLSNQKT